MLFQSFQYGLMLPKIDINFVLFLVYFCTDYSETIILIIQFPQSKSFRRMICVIGTNKSIECYQSTHILIPYEYSVAILHTLPNAYRHQHHHHQHSIWQCIWLSHKLEYVVAGMIIEYTLDCLPTRRCMMCACSITFTAIIMYSSNRKCDFWASDVKVSLMKVNKINKSEVYT